MSRYVSKDLRQRIRDHFNHSRAYCMSPNGLIPVSYEFEHIVPIIAGGASTFDNLCLACPSCNSYKGSSQTALGPETDKEVALFHPHQDTWSDHFFWSDNKTVLLAHTAIGRATLQKLNINRPSLVELRQLWVSLQVFPATPKK